MKRLCLIFLCISTLSISAQTPSVQVSDPLVPAQPESVGMSPDRLSRINTMLENAITENQVPGAVALISKDGKIVFHKAYGMAENASNKEMEKDAIFRIASQTKAITSTAIMILWEQGKFRLDDPISKFIPEFGEAQILDTSIKATPRIP